MSMEERSLTYAKQYFKRNLGKYCADDCFESAIGEYYLREDEIESLKKYIIKNYPTYEEEINRRYNLIKGE